VSRPSVERDEQIPRVSRVLALVLELDRPRVGSSGLIEFTERLSRLAEPEPVPGTTGRDLRVVAQMAVGLVVAAELVQQRLPSERDLRRIRYTPITRPFKQAAELSWRIAKLRGFIASSEEGRAEGLLLDVAELWELFVLNCVRRALSGTEIEHGTVSDRHERLLQSQADGTIGLGRLKPDVLVRRSGRVVAVIDAKYKRLVNTRERPDGVDRGDLYQLASYLGRFAPDGQAPGALIYPRDPDQLDVSTAEAHDPWRNAVGNPVRFIRLALDPADAIDQLAEEAPAFGSA
jgi:5-methylcytosine-specific restriction enzyme subunit McrC